jgi:uncharacterized protein with PIN domain
METKIRFSIDGMLNALAKYLRALGYDAVMREGSFEKFLARAADEDRIVVTMRKKIPDNFDCTVIIPDEGSVQAQLQQLIKTIPLKPAEDRLFTRCLRCNVTTVDVPFETVATKIPAKIRERQASFRTCPNCNKTYWWGSHVDRMMKMLEKSGAFDNKKDLNRGVTRP